MLEIKHNKSYLENGILKEIKFSEGVIHKICFQGRADIVGSDSIIQNIKDYLESTYKMYQYKKDNGVKFGEHELFYWCGEGNLYFDVNLNDKYTLEYNNKIVEEINQYINNNYIDVGLYVVYQYSDINNWDKINEYLNNFELDFNNIPFELLACLSGYCFVAGNNILKENKEKLCKIELEIQNFYKDKKVIYNGIKGTLKELKNNYYGVFKPRATRTYYPFYLSKIRTLELA